MNGAASLQEKSAPASTEPKQDDVIRLTSRLVIVPVSASDASGRPVRDLTADDFVIEEEGRPQRVVPLGEPGQTPLEIVLAFDISGSTNARFEFEQQAATRFIGEVLKPTDSVAVFSIGVTPKLVQARTTSCKEAVTGVKSLGAGKEPTALFDTVVEAARYLGKWADSGDRRVLVVISDGEENYSQRFGLSDALRELQKNDCLFYAINPSGSALNLNRVSVKGQSFLEAMSSETGGKAFVPDNTEEFDRMFGQITAELQAQYLFGYYSTDERADGGFRRITVRAPKRTDLRVRARQGYYAPVGTS
jgi:VWFA-related protein